MDLYEQNIYNRIQRFVPENSAKEAFQLWREKPFRFVVSKARATKLGDFRKKPSEDLAMITVNENLNPYAFLITFVHEVAHHRVYAKYKNKVLPHGVEWKMAFRELMLPFQKPEIFPANILLALDKYMINPKAASLSDMKLAQALKLYDKVENPLEKSLMHLAEGEKFTLDQKIYQKLEPRRTRIKCVEVKTGRNYLVHKMAMVIPCPD
ncbi:transcription elongation protein SprT [Marivirga sp. S37H4]|uniref:Transcription elongation protein SprT n=1 Tax=Marivirga aurantiaca TaxID=2802615 RepID=A0A934WZ99_9BACT|nr:transcription elongation protein SprT [Marivirga aurantiaca]MBK6265597.1 transcription elongation protein SprT [Marivirga aurantiaca]